MQKNREPPRNKHRQVERNHRSTKGKSERNEAPSRTGDSPKRDEPPMEERNGTKRERERNKWDQRTTKGGTEWEGEREKPNGSDEPPTEETNGTEREEQSVSDERERGKTAMARELCQEIYYTMVMLGSPPREFHVQIDTGNDIEDVGVEYKHAMQPVTSTIATVATKYNMKMTA
ncbi:hypothetical protein RIF29_35135 [Crotalaria pallida]|uniref:Peptidase A1 domain-containing protein n=1 Tax=Crotalaria pallida TaxID=3830 RepID=A0AAN9HV10_CROPI